MPSIALMRLQSVPALFAAFFTLACSAGTSPDPGHGLSRAPTPPCPSDDRADCDLRPDNGCETDVLSAADHCGACGKRCGEGERCSRGACVRASALAMGGQACALTPRGAVVCWGKSDGPKSPEPVHLPRPHRIEGVDDAVALSTSAGRACAVGRSGQLTCWADAAPSAELPSVHAVDVAAGSYGGTCALDRSGAVRCTSAEHEKAATVRDAVSLTGDGGEFCALTRSGLPRCWGYGTRIGTLFTVLPAAPLDGAGEGAFTHIAVRRASGCGARRLGDVLCWYSEWDGPAQKKTVFGVVDAVEVAVGSAHACALRRNGEVRCWGNGVHGELGDGAAEARRDPVTVQGLSDALHIGASDETTCAMRRSGDVVCWGSREGGLLGDGQGTARHSPVDVPGVTDATRVSVGRWYSCALHVSGSVSCWGRGAGDLKEPFDHRIARGVPVEKVPRVDGAVALRARADACAVDGAGRVTCWPSGRPHRATRLTGLAPAKSMELAGDEGIALLRTGSAAHVFLDAPALEGGSMKVRAEALPGIRDAVDFATVGRTTCFLLKSGKVACLVEEIPGLGPPITLQGQKPPPRPLPPLALVEVDLTDATNIAAGGYLFCATRKNGEVACWTKWDVDGLAATTVPQLGEAPPTLRRPKSKTKPQIVGSGDHPVFKHGPAICLLLADQVVCRGGHDHYGERGTGDPASPPGTPVLGLRDAVDVSSSDSHACAVRRTGQVVCWGVDQKDECGGTVAPFSTVPVEVPRAP